MSNASKKDTNVAICIELLWKEGFLREGRNLSQVAKRINERWDHNFAPSDISLALTNAGFLRRIGKRGSFHYIQKISSLNKTTVMIENKLFSDESVKKIQKDCKNELQDLRLNFGNSGTCSAFLLRKVLEKLIYIVFARNGKEEEIEDKKSPGGLVGLAKMLDIATNRKINGVPILTAKTAQKIQGIKFLGDTAAHNSLINVDMETIVPQMPFIITAYQELAERL